MSFIILTVICSQKSLYSTAFSDSVKHVNNTTFPNSGHFYQMVECVLKNDYKGIRIFSECAFTSLCPVDPLK